MKKINKLTKPKVGEEYNINYISELEYSRIYDYNMLKLLKKFLSNDNNKDNIKAKVKVRK